MSNTGSWRPIIAALANETARRVYAELVSTGNAVDALNSLSPSRAAHVVKLLLTARMVVRAEDGSLLVNPHVYRELLASAAPPPHPTGVDRFLTADGRIAAYPSHPAQRGELLARIAAQIIAADEVLAEPELNERLMHFTDDVAALRRYLVDHGELERTRSGSEYARPSET